MSLMLRTAIGAANRLLRLRESLQGGVVGVDYRALYEASIARDGSLDRRSSFEATQDHALEDLDDYMDLEAALMAACDVVGDECFQAWVWCRVHAWPVQRAADELERGLRTVERYLNKTDQAVVESLLERQLLANADARYEREIEQVQTTRERVEVIWYGLGDEMEAAE